MKRIQHHSVIIKEIQIKSQGESSSHPQQWLKFKRLITLNVDRMWPTEFSDIIDEGIKWIKWYNYFVWEFLQS